MNNKELREKTFKVIEHIATHGCIEEDCHSADYCKYCNYRYGNVNWFSEVPHNEDCVYIIALELYLNLSKEKQ